MFYIFVSSGANADPFDTWHSVNNQHMHGHWKVLDTTSATLQAMNAGEIIHHGNGDLLHGVHSLGWVEYTFDNGLYVQGTQNAIPPPAPTPVVTPTGAGAAVVTFPADYLKWDTNHPSLKHMVTDKKKKSTDTPWYKKLDLYPKHFTEGTPITERFCVVCENKPNGEMINPAEMSWAWKKPYWVLYAFTPAFAEEMRYLDDEDIFIPIEQTARIYNGAAVRLSFVKDPKNGYVILNSGFNCQWTKKASTGVYIDSMNREQIYPKEAEKNFPLCPTMGKRYPIHTFMNVNIPENGKEVHSLAAIEKLGTIHKCNHCGHFYRGMINMTDLDGALDAPAHICTRCETKYMEKKVIRHYDDDKFLDPIPDIIEFKLQGKAKKMKNPRMFGVELEVGFNEGDRVTNAIDVWTTVGKDFCYIKHDGSITKTQFDDGYKVKKPVSMGFEVVSAPAGINVHRDRWKALSKAKCFPTLRSWDADACGLHVHVSRDSLTWFQIGRILVFMNHENNRYFVEVVAGRASNFYTRYIKKVFTDCAKVDENKYMAVRTNKPKTIEFRIFRGTINYKHIIRNIEFVDAMCDFCAPCVTSLKDIVDFRKFIQFVDVRRSLYPRLAEWLATIEMIAKKPLSEKSAAEHLPLEEALSDLVKAQLKLAMPAVKSKESLEKIFGGCEPKPAAKKHVEVDDDGEEIDTF